MPKTYLIAVCGGLLSLIAAMPALNGAPGGLLLFYVAGLPIYMIGFAYGVTAGTVASLSGFVAATALGGMLLAGVFALVHLLPAWTVIRQAMLQRTAPDGHTEWMPPGPIVASLAGLAASLMLLAGLVFMANGMGLSTIVGDRLSEVLAAVAPDTPQSAREEMVQLYAPLLPASLGSSWVIMALVSATVAQAILARAGRNLRPTPRYANMVLPEWISWAMVGCALVSLVAGGEIEFLARNLSLALAVPFFLLGLAVIHHWARRVRRGNLALVAVYFLIFVVGWAGLLVTAAIGVLEQWGGIRHRLTGPASGTPPHDE
ncbi:MAG: hypothetical protein COW30_05820 [Rhodospirillales bacterium CG15_BIG_FIL_POST_REV_8_21_14_020_66_15]|nr:MAG: hypothetical protein COW30_05820 [Rhodospirillales bacterium CG15_BIG_FIL_POST_REV_8_21_14_020_66_15]